MCVYLPAQISDTFVILRMPWLPNDVILASVPSMILLMTSFLAAVNVVCVHSHAHRPTATSSPVAWKVEAVDIHGAALSHRLLV